MKFEFDKETYNLIKYLDWDELVGQAEFDDEAFRLIIPDEVNYSFESGEKKIKAIRALALIINNNIVMYGLEGQDRCNEYGRKLYNLYDSVILSGYGR